MSWPNLLAAGLAGTLYTSTALTHGLKWDFILPTLDGTRFIQPSQIKGPVLVNFWDTECPPCVRELSLIAAFAHDNPGWTVLLVSTSSPREAVNFLARQNINLPALRGDAKAAHLMRSAGNRIGALPFSVGLKGGVICATHLGELNGDTLANWDQRACR